MRLQLFYFQPLTGPIIKIPIITHISAPLMVTAPITAPRADIGFAKYNTAKNMHNSNSNHCNSTSCYYRCSQGKLQWFYNVSTS